MWQRVKVSESHRIALVGKVLEDHGVQLLTLPRGQAALRTARFPIQLLPRS